ERREDDLERRLLVLRVLVDGDAATVVLDGDARAVLVERDGDLARVAVHGLVDRVVDDLPDQMMEPRAADAPDVHARAFANRLGPLEDLARLGRLFGGRGPADGPRPTRVRPLEPGGGRWRP